MFGQGHADVCAINRFARTWSVVCTYVQYVGNQARGWPQFSVVCLYVDRPQTKYIPLGSGSVLIVDALWQIRSTSVLTPYAKLAGLYKHRYHLIFLFFLKNSVSHPTTPRHGTTPLTPADGIT